MKTIWKSIITPNSLKDEPYRITVAAKKGAIPIHVGVQHQEVCVWFEVDSAAKAENLVLYCVGTGFGAVPDDSEYIGTVVHGNYVWHFYY